MSEARAAYQAGRDIEMNVPGVTMTYNTVNLMVTQLLDDGWDALRYSGQDIITVAERLRKRLDVNSDDLWTLADLGMCEFLREDFNASEVAYRKASDLSGNEERRSMLSKLQEIAERWPAENEVRNEFFETIRNILLK